MANLKLQNGSPLHSLFLAIGVALFSGVGGSSVCSQETVSEEPVTRAYFESLREALTVEWPKNRTIRFVFHGHSVPAGYFKTPEIRRFDSYPSLFHQRLCKQFSTAAIDVCVTAIGGETSERGAARFKNDVLTLKPDVVIIDYSLNDRRLGLAQAEIAWRQMIQDCQQNQIQVILLTPTPDSGEDLLNEQSPLAQHAAQVRRIGQETKVPVVDSYAMFRKQVAAGKSVETFLSQPNHPNRKGHEIVAGLLLELF